MADVNANIGVNIDTSAALANLKNLQRQISAFHTQMAKSGAAAAASSAAMQQNLVNTINQTGKFNASIRTIKSTTESFTGALEKNKLSMGEYFRYAGASTKTFGRLFRSEFDTIDKVARERVKTLQTQYIKMGRDANGAMKAIAVRPVALDMQNLATQTQMAAQKQALFNQLVRQGSTNLLNFGKNTQWAGRQLMVGFTVPLTMLGVVAGRTFMQLEEQAIRFRRVYGETFTASSETDKMLDQIKELAKEFTKYGVAVEKTMEMAATAAASGKMGADLLAQVNEATRLAVLGGVEQQQALETTISLTNAFGIAADQLAKKIDFLNAVENQTVVSIEDLTIAVPKAGPVVQQLGGDVEDLAFFLTAMKEGGINASEGANALKSGLASLINPTGKAAEMLKGFGINIDGIVKANKGDVKGLVVDFASALDELDPLARARAIEQLFGKFQFSRLSTLFKNVIQEGSQASRVLQLTKATTEELAILSERELGNIENTTTYKFKKALEDIKAALAPVGEEFLKALTPIIEIGTKILEAFNNMDSGAKTFIVNLVGIAGVIGPAFLMTFGLIANGFANLIKMFAFLGRAFSGTKASTTDLGLSTQYMTQEQLEAAAVAASLNQAHAKLIQTFTSEAGAVNLLTQAYQRAVAAQGAFSGASVVGRARPPKGGKKYAKGVVSVPGPKGAGDVVPAMLSPGEAVIPAKNAKKYAPLISGMVSGNIPGFRFGLDPFKFMLGRSRVGVRMKSGDFSQALKSSGKDARYQSAFATGTGADYKNSKQALARSAMERDVFGLDPKTTAAGSRSTYGYARTSPLQSIFNSLFGLKGKQFNQVTGRPSKSLDLYGDIDLITKSSVAKRSSVGMGDSLLNYVRGRESMSSRPNYNIPMGMQFPTPPMRGASKNQLGSFGSSFGTPFGSQQVPGTNEYRVNAKPPYLETYTPGGFAFKEIDRVISSNPAIVKQLRAELKAAGLGGVRVTGPGFAARLFKQLGIPGYKDGISKVPSNSQSRQRILDDLTSKLRGAPKSLSDAAKPLNYGSFGKEENAFLNYYKQEILRENPNISKDRLKRLLDNYRGYDLSHLRETTRPVRLADGTMIDAKIFNTKDLIKDARSVNQILENMSTKGGMDPTTGKNLGRGTFLPSLDPKEIAKMAGVSEKVAAKELQSLINKNHPVTRDATKVLSAVSQKYAGLKGTGIRARGLALSRMLQLRLSDTSPGSFFNALASGKLSLGDNPELNKKSQITQIKRIQNANKKLGLIGSTTGSPIGPGTRRGGAPSDTRQVAVSKGEAIVNKKSIDSIRRGGVANLPGIGRLGAVSRFGIPGFADGMPNGQTQGKSIPVPGIPTQKAADDFAKAAPLTQEVKGSKFKRAIGGAFEKAIMMPLAKTINAGVNDLYDSKGNLVQKAGTQTMISRMAARQQAKLEKSAGLERRVDKSGKSYYVDPGKGRVSSSVAQQRMSDSRPQKDKGRAGRTMGGVGALATMGVMGASMIPGQVGQVAQQLMMPVMMLSMVLPMLGSTIGIVAAGLMAVVGGFVAVHLALENIRRETSETTRSLGAGKDAMSKFAEAAGTVTPSEFMDKRREMQFSPFNVKPGKTTFGQAFVQTESGEAMLSEFETQVEKFGRSRAIESLQKKLTTAVATGVLSPEQAKSIANSLGQKLNDYGITANINASIQSILGPDGKLLEGNTIKIYTEFIQESGTGLTGTGGILQSEELTGGAPIWWWDSEKVAQKEGEASGIIANFYDENQQVIDAFDAENLKNIDALFASGDYDKALQAEEKYQKERKDLVNSYNTEIQKMMDDFAGVDGSKQDAILRDLIDTAKQLDPTVGTAADRLRTAKVAPIMVGQGAAPRAEQVAQQEAFKEAKVTFIAQVAAGNIDPKTFNSLIGMFDPTTSAGQATLGVLAKITTDVGPAAVEQLDTVFKVLDNPNLAAEIAVNIEAKDPQEAQKTIDTLTQLSKFDGVGVESKVVLKYFGENPEELDALTERFEKLDLLKKKGTLDVQTLIEQQVLTTGDLAAFKENEAYFNSLDADQKVVYTQVYLSKLETVADSEIAAWKAANPLQAKYMSDDQIARKLANVAATEYTVANPNVDTTVDTKDNTTPTGGGSRQNPLDDLLKQLKEVRNAAVNATGGIQELYKWLGKGKNMTAFKGTANALIAGGTTQDFQDYVLNLDTKEQEKYFDINKKGLLELTKLGRATQKLFNEITIGRFVVDQQRAIQTAKQQEKAAKRLISLGMDTNKAYEMVQDTQLAAAIATIKFGAKGKKEIQKLIAEAYKLEAALMEALSPEEALDILMQDIQDRMNDIDIEFNIATRADQEEVIKAQDAIDKLKYKIDDYEAELQQIAWQEDEINKKYEEQFQAIDRIRKANQGISEQQKLQLTLADALTQGDISQAATAAQELRAKQAQDAIDKQEEALSIAQEMELEMLKSQNGRTRLQIEALILDLEKQIFEIEEKRLEPAQERIRQAEVIRDLKMLQLQAEQDEYEKLMSGIKEATRNTEEYKKKLQAALGVLQKMASVKLPPPPDYGGSQSLIIGPKGKKYWDPVTKTWKKLPTANLAMGGQVKSYSMGGKVMTYMSGGGSSLGSDTVPAMLTPGEFVMKRQAVNKFGTKVFDQLNNGSMPNFEEQLGRYKFNTLNSPTFEKLSGGVNMELPAEMGSSTEFSANPVYNNTYSVNVNVASQSDPNQIANVVMKQMRSIDSQRIRGNSF